MGRANRFSVKVRERAVRMVLEYAADEHRGVVFICVDARVLMLEPVR